LKLRFDDGRTAREIADAMGFPSAFHVYRSLKKVLTALGKLLRERGVSDALP
jgi:DNA-directed RNA polymerase specialized sigma subunit